MKKKHLNKIICYIFCTIITPIDIYSMQQEESAKNIIQKVPQKEDLEKVLKTKRDDLVTKIKELNEKNNKKKIYASIFFGSTFGIIGVLAGYKLIRHTTDLQRKVATSIFGPLGVLLGYLIPTKLIDYFYLKGDALESKEIAFIGIEETDLNNINPEPLVNYGFLQYLKLKCFWIIGPTSKELITKIYNSKKNIEYFWAVLNNNREENLKLISEEANEETKQYKESHINEHINHYAKNFQLNRLAKYINENEIKKYPFDLTNLFAWLMGGITTKGDATNLFCLQRIAEEEALPEIYQCFDTLDLKNLEIKLEQQTNEKKEIITTNLLNLLEVLNKTIKINKLSKESNDKMKNVIYNKLRNFLIEESNKDNKDNMAKILGEKIKNVIEKTEYNAFTGNTKITEYIKLEKLIAQIIYHPNFDNYNSKEIKSFDRKAKYTKKQLKDILKDLDDIKE